MARHRHQCGACRCIWEHDPLSIAAEDWDNQKEHTCPRCGMGPYFARHVEDIPIVGPASLALRGLLAIIRFIRNLRQPPACRWGRQTPTLPAGSLDLGRPAGSV